MTKFSRDFDNHDIATPPYCNYHISDISFKSTLFFRGYNTDQISVVSHALTAGYYGVGQVKAHDTIYGRCLLEAKLEVLPIIFGIQGLKISKPHRNIFGSATMPSKELAFQCPMSRPDPRFSRMSECHGRPLLFTKVITTFPFLCPFSTYL